MNYIGNLWDEVLSEEYEKPYFAQLISAVEKEYESHTVYPPKDKIFSALSTLPYDEVKVVIIGQDPYHGKGQANGMAFAVGKGVQLPPSLVNIFKEIESDCGVKVKGSTLTGWAKQGVLLLNTTLTVREGEAQSHASLGWQTFTDAIIEKIAQREQPLVFMLWGSHAQKKKALIPPRHLVLESVHPSPLSAYRGFFGCKHFSKANEFLKERNMPTIDWGFVDYEEETLSDYYKGKGSISRAK